MLRNPWDVAISLFKQRFVNNIPYASSFFNIGVYIANFEALTNFWLNHKNIKNKIYILRYEDLVDDFTNHQEKIYDFCGIKSSYESSIREKHFARTRSMHQVQNKVNKDSIKKKDFEDFIKNLWSLIYHRENTGLIMEFILKIHILATLIKIFCCKIAT